MTAFGRNGYFCVTSVFSSEQEPKGTLRMVRNSNENDSMTKLASNQSIEYSLDLYNNISVHFYLFRLHETALPALTTLNM